MKVKVTGIKLDQHIIPMPVGLVEILERPECWSPPKKKSETNSKVFVKDGKLYTEVFI